MSVRTVEWGEPLLERSPSPELESRVGRGSRGSGGRDYFTPVPWVFVGLSRLNQRLMRHVALDHDLADLVGLVVSQDNSCRYCYAVQRALLQTVGFADERISRLEETFLLAELKPRERAALEFARRISRSNPLVAPGDLEPLRSQGFGETEIQEIAVVAALNVLFNRTATIAALPPYGWEALPDRWYSRALRPLLSLYLRRGVRGSDAPQTLSEAQRSGPFSYLTNALDGHPVAGDLRALIDEMWGSDLLPRRAKALCFAVVARALGDLRAEREAGELVAKEGLSSRDLDDTLANLASPALDDVERRLVPFSRQTVWYDVPDLQRRARELRAGLATEPFIEVVGVSALANVVCRLGFLAETA